MRSQRKRVDWDAEIQKTENIRRRGLLMSILSFGMAIAFIFGMSRSTGADIEIPRTVLFAVIFCVSCVILRVIMKHRSEKRKRNHENSL
ncbi:MAG: hypothetical protein IJQ15_03935 [Synergistaceae bacterium]|nr:hypothetical protein [Synergistaceae bacterium]MBQ6113969.1 hypothetical protein [Synergistaceae bacterium]MBQ6417175.1 hypothetical protein [Synergistaceae bacterium]MBQ6981561.1 hypothetical protein [Synergistaceae bacterium]MBR0186726.1 hypothetical protein [Synergistaceae bacterium]